MKPISSSWLARFCAVLLFLQLHCSSAFGQVDHKSEKAEIPAEVRRELEEQAAVLTRVLLSYNEHHEGGDAVNFSEPTKYLVYFETNRFYLRTDYAYKGNDGEVARQTHEDAFDGNLFYYGDPPSNADSPGILQKFVPGDLSDPLHNRSIFFRYPEAAGFRPPGTVDALVSFRGLTSLVLDYLGESKSSKIETEGNFLRVTVKVADPILLQARSTDLEYTRKNLESLPITKQKVAQEIETLQKMQLMVPERSVVFLLDPARKYAVVEREDFTATGEKIVKTVSDQWKLIENRVWLPGRCVETYYTDRFTLQKFSPEPIAKITLNLDRVELEKQTNFAFVLQYNKPGDLIVERGAPEAKHKWNHQVSYTVAADGSLLQNVATDVARRTNRKHSALWTAVLLTLFVLPFCVLFVRKIYFAKDQ